MKILNEDEDITYTKVLLGGSIGERPVVNIRLLKGEKAVGGVLFSSKKEALASAKQSNENLSPGEKNYYGLKWVVAEIKGGFFTGK